MCNVKIWLKIYLSSWARFHYYFYVITSQIGLHSGITLFTSNKDSHVNSQNNRKVYQTMNVNEARHVPRVVKQSILSRKVAWWLIGFKDRLVLYNWNGKQKEMIQNKKITYNNNFFIKIWKHHSSVINLINKKKMQYL